jgi:hypothetical protein
VVTQRETAALKAAGSNKSSTFTRKLARLFTPATLLEGDMLADIGRASEGGGGGKGGKGGGGFFGKGKAKAGGDGDGGGGDAGGAFGDELSDDDDAGAGVDPGAESQRSSFLMCLCEETQAAGAEAGAEAEAGGAGWGGAERGGAERGRAVLGMVAVDLLTGEVVHDRFAAGGSEVVCWGGGARQVRSGHGGRGGPPHACLAGRLAGGAWHVRQP